MKIAIDISPLDPSSGHKVRGVGFYLKYLKEALLKYHPENKYNFFTHGQEPDKDADLVHYPYFDPFFLTLPQVKKYPTVVTVHDLTPLVFPKRFPAGLKGTLRWQIQKHNLKKSDGIIADSQVSKEDIVRITGLSQEKVNVVHLAAAEEFRSYKVEGSKVIKSKGENDKNLPKLFWGIRNKYNLPQNFVLYVGDGTWNKNLPNLIKAIKEINLTLVMVGKSLADKGVDFNNPWNKDLAEVQKLSEGDKRIIKLGFVPTEDLVALYNMATVFVMPSIYEGFGLPILEAMQSGCPVVTTKGGSIPEVAGEAAYYVNGHDINEIANGIGEVFFSQKLREEMREKGIKQAGKFSWKETARKTIEVYERVIKL